MTRVKVCVIGNSHAACWLAAWRAYRERFKELAKFRFFVLGGYDCDLLEVEGGTLRLESEELSELLRQTSEGLDFIDPSDYDYFIIVSLTSGFRNLTPLFSQYGLALNAPKVEGVTFISRSCIEESVSGILENSSAIKLRRKLSQITNKPVILSPSPCQSENILLTKQIQFAKICLKKEQVYLYEMFKTAMKDLANKYNFSVLFQQEHTMIKGGGYTLAKYSVGSINSRNLTSSTQRTINVDSNDSSFKDHSHMNIKFGRSALIDVIEKIQTLPKD